MNANDTRISEGPPRCPIRAHYRTLFTGDGRGGSRRETAAKAPSWLPRRIENRAVLPRLDGRHPRRQRPVRRRDPQGFRREIPWPRQQFSSTDGATSFGPPLAKSTISVSASAKMASCAAVFDVIGGSLQRGRKTPTRGHRRICSKSYARPKASTIQMLANRVRDRGQKLKFLATGKPLCRELGKTTTYEDGRHAGFWPGSHRPAFGRLEYDLEQILR
jgi:hypothetical protein